VIGYNPCGIHDQENIVLREKNYEKSNDGYVIVFFGIYDRMHK
jgi:hypothetical protein